MIIKNFKTNYIKSVLFSPPLDMGFELEEYFDIDGGKITGLDECYVAWNQMAMNTAGDVFWHMRCFNDYILGNVNNSSLRQIYHGEKAESFRTVMKACVKDISHD